MTLEKRIFCFWTGDNQITEGRKWNIKQIRNNSGCKVEFITSETVHIWELNDYPYHSAYKYLSAVHKADYLRAYFMHHYGGGYCDIKPVYNSWINAFKYINNNDTTWIVGYPEESPNDIAHVTDMKLYEDMKNKYNSLIGNCAYICKPNTILTKEWLETIHNILDSKYEILKNYPAPHPRVMNEEDSMYALRWTEICGNIFHPLCYKYLDNICTLLPKPDCKTYLFSRSNNMRIGVCIPCHEPHIQYLEKCLESIEQQTRKPDLVCLSISGTLTPPDLPSYSFPIKISYNSNKQCAGKNRNIAASLSYSMDILSFFDADDIMHPRRLETIEQHLQQVDAVLHSHRQCSSKYRTIKLTDIPWEEITSVIRTDGFTSTRDICGRVQSIYGPVTSGHFSCKREVYNALQYPEGYGLGEDAEYVYRVHQKYRIGYCQDILSYYIRTDFTDEYVPYTSEYRPPVYSNYDNSEMENLIEFLLSERSPERQYTIRFNLGPNDKTNKILYNIEQLTRSTELQSFLQKLKTINIIEIWDYSITNYNILKELFPNVRHVPFRLSIDKIMRYRALNTTKSYDIAFCGAISDYRMKILEELRDKGKEVLILDNLYTAERDVKIGKAKLLINIHYNETYKVFELVRCEPWLASGFPVLSEESIDNDPRCTTVPYDQLVQKACEMLDDTPLKYDLDLINNVAHLNKERLIQPKKHTTLVQDKNMKAANRTIYIQVEPEAIHPIQLTESYFAILTFNDTILKTYKNAYKYIFSFTLIEPQHHNPPLELKEYLLTTLVTSKIITESHQFRQVIYNNQKQITIPTQFYRSSNMPDINNNPIIGPRGPEKFVMFNAQFHLAIENSKQINYFTEKLCDCLVTKTIPVYYGCPNISEFFDTTGWILLETMDMNELLQKLQVITPDYYKNHIQIIEANYKMVQNYIDLDENVNRALRCIPEY